MSLSVDQMMRMSVDEITENIKKQQDSPYREISVFKNDASALGLAVTRLREAGINTDIACLVEGLVEKYLDELEEEEMSR